MPSRLLLEQWIEEVDLFIDDASIMPAGTGFSDWKKKIHIWLDSKQINGKKRITIAIIDSGKTKKFISNLN